MSCLYESFLKREIFFCSFLKNCFIDPFQIFTNPLSEIRITNIFSLFVALIFILATMLFSEQVALNIIVVILVSLFLYDIVYSRLRYFSLS